MNRKKRLTSLFRWVAIILGCLIIGLYILFPLGMGIAAIIPGRETVGSPPPGFDEIELQTEDGIKEDGITLAAWYAPPTNGAAILLLHGAGGSREQLRPYAEMLLRNGYGVLALDLRGHGMSAGPTNRLGWESTADVKAAVAYLQTRPEVDSIGGMGLSMGGEVLLGAASEAPGLRAMVADGATRRSLQKLLALPSERPLARNFTARVMFAGVQLFGGGKPPKPFLESMLEANSTSFLFIAGGAKKMEVDFNELFAETIGERSELWIAPEASHTGAFTRYPDEYEQRVIDFFDRALLGQ
jgi:pimeloyl-ACP methyl ester carboxylesterase